MAQKVQVLLVDDLDGGEADETVSFALDVEHARKAGTTRRRRSRGASSRERSADIRAWAKARGIKVNERGRIPASVVEQYEAAH
ncbi:Lsr2 family protein [Thermomonospora sp. CIF 1]|uniref:histone-like nucleoid-structuring protein Lsr2 n=1 Tax=Thermomonospora sp. CIF 1 TaxID=1916083 RepID=UPI000A82ED31|nr:Lsr2 family protein [Thermomonospora sp. CIF 1]PKK12223.1 MAG: hypothetical protein BUE48_022030 [Thermomonospora sp. CIF 1]